MRGIMAQVVLPVGIASLVFLVATLAGYPLPGVVAGAVAGGGVALRNGRRAIERLRYFHDLRGGDAETVPAAYPMSGDLDEIDDAFTHVASRMREMSAEHAEQLEILTRQNQLLDRMNDGIMRVDASGTVSWANVAAGALFRGRNPAGRSFIAVTRDHELDELVTASLRTGEDRQHTFEIPGDPGVYNAVITRISDTPAEALVVLRDITEVTRLQTLRRDFVANVSHDLRTPLSAIKIMTETLLELNEDDAGSRDFLGRIDDEVNVMTALVNDLLELASLEGRESRLTMRQIGLHQLVEDVRARMEPIASRHDVTISVSVDETIGSIEADEYRLQQALTNLVNNAIVHTPAGGRVDLNVFREGDQVTFEVRDTGVGIHPNDLPRVWERFFRADRARSGRGTGLGLAIVKHVVLAHGGTIDASSDPGQGSTFRITVPMTKRTDMLPARPVSD